MSRPVCYHAACLVGCPATHFGTRPECLVPVAAGERAKRFSAALPTPRGARSSFCVTRMREAAPNRTDRQCLPSELEDAGVHETNNGLNSTTVPSIQQSHVRLCVESRLDGMAQTLQNLLKEHEELGN